MKLKVCGMNHNTEAVAALLPDYLGFIFWTPSSRAFTGTMPVLPKTIKKVGVFVDAPLETVQEKVQQYGLDAVQLHGQESPEYCQALLHNLKGYGNPELIKVFSIKGNDFDFSTLSAYETVCDYYLFDTKGALPGGNGYTFDWTILEEYPSTKPYFLSG
ncbi:MAG: phosphoribosylanthranilate isomerase, partial [Bacteroidota bacterium]